MFVVFKRTVEAELETIEVSNGLTARQIDPLVSGVNWYGSKAASAEEAIAEAQTCGFKYRSQREMLKLVARATSLGDQSDAHVRDQR